MPDRVPDRGRLPGNIKSNYGGFTAAQWKNFVLLFEMYCLKDVLPDQHLHYWQSFVLLSLLAVLLSLLAVFSASHA